MKSITWKIVLKCTISLPNICGMVLLANLSFAQADAFTLVSSSAPSQTQTTCPKNLTILKPEIEKALHYVTSASFREALLASLEASIPEAIEQADGLSTQIAFLKQEIIRQERERLRAETVAREESEDPSKPLRPCRRGVESSYCSIA